MSSDSLEEEEKILTVYYIDGFDTLARIGSFRTQHPEVTLQAVKKLCGFSIIVSLMTVPF